MNEGETRTLQAATKEIKSVHNTSGPYERSTDERNALLQKENLSPKTVIHACTSKDTSTHVTDGKINYDFSNRSKSAGHYLNNCVTCWSHNYYKSLICIYFQKIILIAILSVTL